MRSPYSTLSWKKAEASTGWRGASRPAALVPPPEGVEAEVVGPAGIADEAGEVLQAALPVRQGLGLGDDRVQQLAGGDRAVVVLVVDLIQLWVGVLDGEAEAARADAVAPRGPALEVEADLVLVGVGLGASGCR